MLSSVATEYFFPGTTKEDYDSLAILMAEQDLDNPEQRFVEVSISPHLQYIPLNDMFDVIKTIQNAVDYGVIVDRCQKENIELFNASNVAYEKANDAFLKAEKIQVKADKALDKAESLQKIAETLDDKYYETAQDKERLRINQPIEKKTISDHIVKNKPFDFQKVMCAVKRPSV